jgi:hypothetical protein
MTATYTLSFKKEQPKTKPILHDPPKPQPCPETAEAYPPVEKEPDTCSPPQFAGFCFTMLQATSCAPHARGAALVKLEDPAVVVVLAMNLPAPCEFGPDYETYKAWVIDPKFSRFRLDMVNLGDGVWLAGGEDGCLVGYNQILVTPEPCPGITTPTGPTVLEASLDSCKSC